MTGENRTLYIPLWGKARMSREGLFPDPDAQRIVDSLDAADFKGVDRSRKLAIYLAMRAALFDEWTLQFAREHPDGLILQLGVGLDSRVNRAPCSLPWYDLDVPAVTEVRGRYFPESARYHLIAAPATPCSWLDALPDAPCALVIAEGLSMYLSREDMLALMQALQRKFPRTLFLFDAYSTLAARLSPLRNPVNAMKARIDFALDDLQTLIGDFPGARRALESGIITPKGLSRLRGMDARRFRLMARPANRLYRIFGVEIVNML